MREDWIECSLLDVCDIHDNLRKPINSKERNKRIEGKNESELFPYYGATGQVGFIDDFLTNGDFILIGEDAAPFLDYTKNVAYKISGKTWVNNHAHILKSKLNDAFLLHYLNNFNYNGYVSGTTRLKLTQSRLKQIPINLAPLLIQRAIVSKIETLFSDLDNGIANLKKAQEQLKIYRQAVLKKAFEGELTKEWRKENSRIFSLPTAEELLKQIKEERLNHYNQQIEDWKKAVKEWEQVKKNHDFSQQPTPKKPSKPKALKELPPLTEDELKKLPHLPKGWQWCKTGMASYINPKILNKALIDDDFEVQFVPMRLVEEIVNKIHLTEIKSFKELQGKSYTYFAENDVLFAKVTPCMENGKIAIAKNIKNNIGFGSSEFHIFRCTSIIDNQFLFHYIVQSEFRNNSRQSMSGAVGLLRVPTSFIENYPIPIPSIQEQHQIVQEIETRLSVCDKVEQSISESLEKAKALRQSILKKAFEGRLLSEAEVEACKQEKDYEPASVLLEKIKAEKLAKEQEDKKNTKKKSRKK